MTCKISLAYKLIDITTGFEYVRILIKLSTPLKNMKEGMSQSTEEA